MTSVYIAIILSTAVTTMFSVSRVCEALEKKNFYRYKAAINGIEAAEPEESEEE